MARARIYTKTGDTGKTRLWDGTQVSKNDPHIETNGTLDEVNAALGLAKSLAPACMADELNGLQDRMMLLMAYVARGGKERAAPDPAELEAWIDAISGDYPMEGRFVNPGESPAGGALHIARAAARRAERASLPLLDSGELEPMAYSYINRLSDLLFALAHKADIETGVERVTAEVLASPALRAAASQGELSLALAEAIIAEAKKKAAELGRAAVIAVCDASGELIALGRMDGALPVSLSQAQKKARSSARMRRGTAEISPLTQPGAQLFGINDEPGGFSAVGGGRLLRAGESVLGAVGVSGGSAADDIAIADAAALFFNL